MLSVYRKIAKETGFKASEENWKHGLEQGGQQTPFKYLRSLLSDQNNTLFSVCVCARATCLYIDILIQEWKKKDSQTIKISSLLLFYLPIVRPMFKMVKTK